MKLKTKTSIDNQRNFNGKIISIVDQILQIETEEKTLNINWGNIEKIRIIYETGKKS